MRTRAKPDWRLWPAAPVRALGAVARGLVGQPTMAAIPDADAPASFADARRIVDRRCHVWHSAGPRFPEFAEAPKG